MQLDNNSIRAKATECSILDEDVMSWLKLQLCEWVSQGIFRRIYEALGKRKLRFLPYFQTTTHLIR